jgi:hypothetical protein
LTNTGGAPFTGVEFEANFRGTIDDGTYNDDVRASSGDVQCPAARSVTRSRSPTPA